jgi:CRP-like cAMP-binding protein
MDDKVVGGVNIPKCLPSTDVFGKMSREDLQTLSDAGEWVVLTDEYVMIKGSEITHTYYIYQGEVEIFIDGKDKSGSNIDVIGAGNSIGEVSFLSSNIAKNDVKAKGKVILWKIPHAILFKFLSSHAIGAKVQSKESGSHRELKVNSPFPKCLPNNDIFGNLASGDLQALTDAGQWEVLNDDYLMKEGAEITHIYYIYEGEVEVLKNKIADGQKERESFTLGSGNSLGEVSFLSTSTAQSDVKAKGKVVIWKIDHPTMFKFLSSHVSGAQICMNIAGILAERVQNANNKIINLSDHVRAYLAEKKNSSSKRSKEVETIKKLEALLSDARITNRVPQQRVTKFEAPKKSYNTIIYFSIALIMSLAVNFRLYIMHKDDKAESAKIEESMKAFQ